MINKFFTGIFKPEGNEKLVMPKDIHVDFYLDYKDLHIGVLSAAEGMWKFEYSDAFKNQVEIQTLMDFPDVNKTYVSEELWPFFAYRIPGLNQPQVQEIIRKNRIDENNEVDLLRVFGKRSINNPFVLSAA